ncbi:SE1561 family protein [Staphylococcus pettenkoferi]|uniref:SE1561 family protein n=1 Tax=Staphylococcus pettenkoferi TaxID=170573 RepID=A0ABT4BQU1_9STAP|nr:SE1561 family protein [Staphylococcus pettenkoferi]MCY1565222.1 SE1561 family protein [Staphylococcus pettenkoferi]MCY1572450.1 SE1561 family protein [Staphylococcus pettenkoferi]MCY1584110.1 SE1561 family protein [Staphylococcus pettenkoferi]MCY1590854.1 SE1561 family protein [Staphylococcus pettenkoferi]MCY1592643.1 SE1561 family protein [Staphylococcus pettenkoferi]
MSETQTIDQIKSRLEQFITDIDQVNPNQVRVEDIDEWIGLLDQLEEKVKSVSHSVDEQ